MKNRKIALGLAAVLVLGTIPSGVASQAEASTNVSTGSGVIVAQTIPEPTKVTVLSVKKDTSLKKVTVTWTAVSDVNGYYVMRKSGGSGYQTIASVTGASYTDTSVKAGSKYTYQVVAWRKAPTGEIKIGAAANDKSISLVPGKVTGLKVKKGRRKFTVTWKKTKGATGYQVYTKVFVKGIKTKYNKAKTLKSRKYKRGMLVKGMKYGFKVRAYKKVNGKKVYGPFTTKTKRY